MDAGLGALSETIDALLDVDLDTLDDTGLHDALIALQRERARLGAVAARLTHSWVRRGVWADDGSRSPAARLARDTGTSLGSARTELRRARQLAHMPATFEALAQGRVSLDRADLFANARQVAPDTFAEHEADLLDICAPLRHAGARRALDYWAQRADPDRAGDRDRGRSARARLSASTTFEGMVAVNGMLDPVGGEIFCNELDRLEHQLYLDDQRTGTARTSAQRRAAALVEMATRSASTPADTQRPRPLFTVMIGEDSLRELCELETSRTVIHPGTLAPHVDDAVMEVVLFDNPHTVISVSHRRTFTGALRRAIQARDRHCQHEAGCDDPSPRCDVDHIVPASRGGPTSQHNGQLACTTHNRQPHHQLTHRNAPWPERAVHELDHIRARLRWHEIHRHPPPPDQPGP